MLGLWADWYLLGSKQNWRLSKFLLPNETNYRILADYLNEIQNSMNAPRIENILYKIPKDTVAYLNTNAPEWFRPGNYRRDSKYPPKKFALLERWENFGDDMDYVYDDEDGNKTAGFRIVRHSNEMKAESSNSGVLIIILISIIFLKQTKYNQVLEIM